MFFIELLKLPAEFLGAIVKILFRPKILALCIVPYLIGLLFFGLAVYSSWELAPVLANYFYAGELSWLQKVINLAALLFLILTSAILGLTAAFGLGGFFLESVIEILLKEKGVNIPESTSLVGFASSTIRGLRDDLFRIILVGLLTILAFILGLFPPLLVIPFFIGVLLVGYNFIDLPLALIQTPFKQRIKLVRENLSSTLALGTFFSLLLMIPFLGLIFMPAGYYLAVSRIATWVREEK